MTGYLSIPLASVHTRDYRRVSDWLNPRSTLVANLIAIRIRPSLHSDDIYHVCHRRFPTKKFWTKIIFKFFFPALWNNQYIILYIANKNIKITWNKMPHFIYKWNRYNFEEKKRKLETYSSLTRLLFNIYRYVVILFWKFEFINRNWFI